MILLPVQRIVDYVYFHFRLYLQRNGIAVVEAPARVLYTVTLDI